MDIGVALDSATAAAQAGITWIVARPFWLLLTLQILDVATGVLVAFKEHRVSSKISREGMTRKVGFILAAAFGSLLEPFVSGPAFGQSIAWLLCAPEAISIAENLKRLGVPLPFGGRLSDERKP